MIRQHISGAVVAVIVVLGFALISEDQPIVSYDRGYSTLDVKAGQVVSINAVVTRDKACSSSVRRDWIDPNGAVILSVIHDNPEVMDAGTETYSANITIPVNAHPGQLRQRVRATFYCNPLQRLFRWGSDFVLPDVIFNVKP